MARTPLQAFLFVLVVAHHEGKFLMIQEAKGADRGKWYLPAGGVLVFLKLDQARFETYTPARDDEADVNRFWLYGVGYGLTPWLSLYGVLPYNVKVAEDNGFNSAGFADPSLLGVVGLTW